MGTLEAEERGARDDSDEGKRILLSPPLLLPSPKMLKARLRLRTWLGLSPVWSIN